MKKGEWSGYFKFSRKERAAILCLLVAIVGVGIAPAFFDVAPSEKIKTAAVENLARLNAIDEQLGNADDRIFHEEKETNEKRWDAKGRTQSGMTTTVFEFDPNTLSPEGWKKLGLRERTIQTIGRYLSKGGKFKTSRDLYKIYGLPAEDVQRLEPYVRISSTQYPNGKGKYAQQDNFIEPKEAAYSVSRAEDGPALQKGKSGHNNGISRSATVRELEINRADSADWESLPGIGQKLAGRIVLFREKLGGFVKVEQVGEVYGISDSVFNRLKTWLVCDPAPVKKINVNLAALEDLRQHPYVRWKLANAIIRYREQHGPFRELSAIRQTLLITENELAKLLPYLSVE